MKSSDSKLPRTAIRNWTKFVIRRHDAVIAAVVVLTAMLASGIAFLEVAVEPEDMIPTDPVFRADYDELRETFSSDETILILVETPGIFDPLTSQRLGKFHEALETRVPHVEEVQSLINARETIGTPDELIVRELFDPWPTDAAALRSLRDRALMNPAYRGTLLSDDAEATIVTLRCAPEDRDQSLEEILSAVESEEEPLGAPLLRTAELAQIVSALDSVRAEFDRPDFRIHYLGGPVLSHVVAHSLQADMGLFTGLSIAAVAALLWALFRRASGVILPLIAVTLPLLCTFGAMGWLGIPLSPATQIIPSFLVAVGVTDAVHLLARFYREYDATGDRRQAVEAAMEHCGTALILTSTTTAASLFAFVFAEIEMIASLGVSAPIGVLLALAFTLSLLPAMLTRFAVARPAVPFEDSHVGVIESRLADIAVWSARRPGLVAGFWGCCVLVGLVSASQLRFQNDAIRWFDADHPLREAIVRVNDRFGAGDTMTVFLDSGRPEGIQEPEVLAAMDEMARLAESIDAHGVRVARAVSLVDVVKETHRALHENRPDRYVVPGQREVIAQELLLFESEGADELERYVDGQRQRAQITLSVNKTDELDHYRFSRVLAARLSSLAPDSVEIDVTGRTILVARSVHALISSMASSYVIALILIVPMMALALGATSRGLVSMIPNLVPIVIAMGVMAPLGIPLDIFTMLIASIAIGISVDDTIHFMHSFHRFERETGEVEAAVRKTIESIGSALFVTTVVLVISFLVFVEATMVNLRSFGLITAFCIVVAFLADVTLSPALVALTARWRGVSRGHEPSAAREVAAPT